MTKKMILGAIVLLLVGILPVGAQNTLYVYGTSANQIYPNTHKIVFTGASMSVFAADGAVTSITYDALKFFSLKNFDISTGAKQLPLLNEEPIATRYYNLQGMEIAEPQSGEVYLTKSIYRSGAVKISKSAVIL
ncbi:MAG: hypothetical protein PHG06_03470 [Parabacteroides sp.]|nr:hypothetical protein [Parabacteroides sp.]